MGPSAHQAGPSALLPVRIRNQLLVPIPTVALTVVASLLLWHVALRHAPQPLERAGQAWQFDSSAASPSPNVAGKDAPEQPAPQKPAKSEKKPREETWPVSREFAASGRCGNGEWQREYKQMHAAMLRGEIEPRHLVARGWNGLADSLVGAVTLFYVAVLQRRAFFMEFGGETKYEWAFTKPNIDWKWDKAKMSDPETTWELKMHSKEPDLPAAKTIRNGDVRTIGANYTTLIVKTNKGYTWPLLNNVNHKDELWAMGLNPNTIFACAIDFLLRPRPETLRPHSEQLAALQEPGALRIGIHVRVGDSQLVKGREHPGVDFFGAFFDCAAQIEQSQRRDERQKVVYFLISDSLQLRREAAEKYGDKVVTSLELLLGHSRAHSNLDASDVKPAFRAAAAEMWLFSVTDYQVVSIHSGYGRVGSFASGRFHQSYGIDLWKDATEPPANIKCGRDDYMKRWNC